MAPDEVSPELTPLSHVDSGGEDGISGVLPVLLLPLSEDGRIQFDELVTETHWVLDTGASGVVLGMVSEILRLSDRERDAVTAEVCAASGGQGHTIASVGAESTHTACERALKAEEAGISAVMAIPPLATKLSVDKLFAYYASILQATDVPLIVQDASSYVGEPLPLDLCRRLLDSFGDRVYFKPEAQPVGQQIGRLRRATDSQARVFDGTGGVNLLESFPWGLAGSMPGADLSWAVVHLWELLQSNRLDDAHTVNAYLAFALSVASGLDAYIAVAKYLMHTQGVIRSASVRGPVGFTLDRETEKQLAARFSRLQDAVSATSEERS